jgi:hypothetical protein
MAAQMRGRCAVEEHHLSMSTVLAIGLVLTAWTVLPFPLAVLVGRSLRSTRI